MMKKSLYYSAITLAVTLVIGQILLILFSEGNSIGSSVLFIFNELNANVCCDCFCKIRWAESSAQRYVFAERVYLLIYLGNR